MKRVRPNEIMKLETCSIADVELFELICNIDKRIYSVFSQVQRYIVAGLIDDIGH